MTKSLMSAAASLVLAACTAAPDPSASAPPTSEEIVFGEATSLGVVITEDDGTFTTDGGVMSMRLANLGDSPVTGTHVEPVGDDGLTVEYLGYSDCARGCAGALWWNEEAIQRVEQGRDGWYPFKLRPFDELVSQNDPAVSLIFTLTVDDARGMEKLRAGCLHLRSIVLETEDGSTMTVSGVDGHWIAAINVQEPFPSGYEPCDES